MHKGLGGWIGGVLTGRAPALSSGGRSGSHSPGGPGGPLHLGRHSLLPLPGRGGKEVRHGGLYPQSSEDPHTALVCPL